MHDEYWAVEGEEFYLLYSFVVYNIVLESPLKYICVEFLSYSIFVLYGLCFVL